MTSPSSSASRRSGQHHWSPDRERTSLDGLRRRRDRHLERLFRVRASRIRGSDVGASRDGIGVGIAGRLESADFALVFGLGHADRVSRRLAVG